MNWITIKNPLFASGPDDGFAKFHFEYTSKSPPEELFHYTTEDNLVNILRSGNLWATECSFLSDESEMRAGKEVFRLEAENFDDKLFVELINSALNVWNDSWMYFVISLSEHGDLLSQWRAYANDGSGCSLSLNAKSIRNRAGFGEFIGIDADKLPKENSNFYHLLKIVYDNEEKKKIASQFLRCAYQQFIEFKASDNILDIEDRETFILIVALRLKDFIISFKNSEFSEEREWRIVSSLHRNDPAIDWRHTRYGIAPFTKTNISPREQIEANRLPLIRVILGPRNKSKSNQKGLALLLERMKYEIEITLSQCSYR